jgi:hypothetical protein
MPLDEEIVPGRIKNDQAGYGVAGVYRDELRPVAVAVPALCVAVL